MKIPCAKRLGFVVSGLSFLQPALTNAQMYDFTLVATALILGSRLHLTEISCMLLKEKAVSNFPIFFRMQRFVQMNCECTPCNSKANIGLPLRSR